jgi:hypothetical protein
MKTFNINGYVFQTTEAHAPKSCSFCIFDDGAGCALVALPEIQSVLKNTCVEDDIIYKDVTANEKASSEKTLFDKEEGK